MRKDQKKNDWFLNAVPLKSFMHRTIEGTYEVFKVAREFICEFPEYERLQAEKFYFKMKANLNQS